MLTLIEVMMKWAERLSMRKLESIIRVVEFNHSLGTTLSKRREYVIFVEGLSFDSFELLLQILISVHGATKLS